jgi:hypothetical protein
MRTILIAAAGTLAAYSATVAAQGEATAAPGCYIEVHRLMAEPPAGLGELGAAIRQLDVQLRPQVEEINALKAQIARLQQRQVQPATSVQEAVFQDDDDSAARPALTAGDPATEELTRLNGQLGEKQAQLKLDYAAKQQALLGPVQARISRGAQAFQATSGCAEVKMARAPDLAALTAAGARDVTGDFVAWYLANPPA